MITVHVEKNSLVLVNCSEFRIKTLLLSNEHYRSAIRLILCSLSFSNPEPILRRVKRTTSGFDGFQQCAYELVDVVTGILNCSFSTGTLPSQWLTAVISSVPKVSASKVLSYFRPISVTSITSRIAAEKLLVTRWLRPSIPVSFIYWEDYAGYLIHVLRIKHYVKTRTINSRNQC